MGAAIVAFLFLVFIVKWILSLRRVVSTNEAHVVRKGSATMEYGGTKGGSYYQWPEWVPAIGVSVTKLSLENFVLPVDDYEAYDKEKLPFVVDIRAFFHIKDCMMAATRASSMDLLRKQLADVVKGAVRTILAQDDLEKIMVERSKYGDEFTKEVNQQLASWGVETIKTIELMDIRDSHGEEVISNIMAKKKSAIEKDSRVTVAKNHQEAKEAEIAAQQEIDLKQKAADEVVGLREAEVEKKVGIAKQQSEQAVKEEAKVTMEKDMEVRQVETVRSAEIARDAKVVEAEADRRKTEIDAEAAKRKAELEAEARLVQATKNAEGIEAEGRAKAEAEEKMQMASVTAQTTLAKEVGENEGYQKYLIEIRKVEATEKVGLEQAKNMAHADIKVIANAGDVAGGVSSALDVLTPKGGVNLAGALEAFAATEAGKALLDKFGVKLG
jgi:flotillin